MSDRMIGSLRQAKGKWGKKRKRFVVVGCWTIFLKKSKKERKRKKERKESVKKRNL